MIGYLFKVLGVDDVSGPWYAFWSGFGSDISEVTLAVGVIALWRKHICETKGCWRLARHTTAGGHHVCRRHHPEGEPTHNQIVEAHHRALRG